MKYLLASLPALASVASAAQVIGTYYVPMEPAPASTPDANPSAPTGESTLSMATSTQPYQPDQTPAPAPSWAYTEEVPYWTMTKGGYQQMPCGYGYYKDTQGYCQPESWWDQGGCYETVIINKKKHCTPMVVTMTEEVTAYVTEKMPKVVYSTTTLVDKKVETATMDVTQVVTMTELMTTTRIWVSTEINDKTKTVLHTLTATDTLTSIATMTEKATATETATKIEKEVLTKTEQAVTTVVQPTTYTSIWLTTEVNNETETVIKTNSKTVTDNVTEVKTVENTATVTETATAKQTDIVETTVVSQYTTTEVVDKTRTTERVVETTIAQTKTSEVTETAATTTTVSRSVQETALMGCLYNCKSQYSMVPAPPSYGNQQQYNNQYPPPPSPSYY